MDQKLTLFSGTDLVGYLLPSDGLKNAQVTLDLVDNANLLKFDLPVESSKWDLLDDLSLNIQVDGHEFVLMNPIDKDRDGKLWGHVEMSESQALLGRVFKTVGSVDLAVTILSGEAGQGGYDAGSAGSALYRLLDGSDWSVGTVDVTGTHDLETEKMNLLENIFEVKKIWGGWLVFDSINKTVSLRDDDLWVTDTGFEIRHTKNMKTLKRSERWEGVVTKLWPFGEKDLDIASVNGGVKYLTNTSYTTEVREGIWKREDIADPTELKTAATKHLADVCHPQVQYSGRILDLRTLTGHTHETFTVGEIVTIQDEILADAVKVRLIYQSYEVLQPWTCDVKLGDPITTSWNTVLDAQSRINQIYGGAKYTIRDFSDRNDRISTTPANPVVAADGNAVDHTLNTDGSVDISFEWSFTGSGDAYNIDGFIVYSRASTSADPYEIGTTPAEEEVHTLPASARYRILRGQPANLHYTFGVQSYRIVDPDVDSSEVLKSSVIQPSLGTEDPYQPQENVAFSGDVTGTIGGVPHDRVSKTPATFVVGDTDTSLNVKRADYVVPTGATNAQVTIQEAIDDLGAGGGEVVLLDGTFDMTDHITVPANVSVRGQGNSTVVKSAGVKPGGTNALIELLDDGATVRDLHIQGVGAATDTWRGIYAEWTSGTPLQDLKVMNVSLSDLGLPPIYAHHISNSEITGCVVRDCAATTMIYVPINTRIHNNSFDNITTEFAGALLVSGDGSERGRNVTITGNTARNCNSAGIYLIDLDGGVVANNAVSGSRYCDPFDGWGICVDADNIQISGNDCSQNEAEGILVSWHSTGIVVTGNICVANGQRTDDTYANIRMDSCSGCSVQGNTTRIGTYALHSGTAQAGGANTITLAASASATDDAYNGKRIWITAGTGSGQDRLITDYVGSTKVATVDSAWGTQPNNTSVYEIKGRAKYGLHLSSASEAIVATNNDLLTGGVTASLQDDGTDNITAAGNRV